MWKITEIVPLYSVGAVTARDRLAVKWSKYEILETVRDFVSLSVDDARTKYKLGNDARDWKVHLAQKDVQDHGLSDNYATPILYRPFDNRFTYYTGRTRGFIGQPQQRIMRQVIEKDNLGISTTRSIEIGRGWEHIFCTSQMIQHHTVSLKEVNYLFPLYLYPNNENKLYFREDVREKTERDLNAAVRRGDIPASEVRARLERVRTSLRENFPEESDRWPNLSPEFVLDLSEKLGLSFVADGKGDLTRAFGPEDVFHYAYAVFHSPTYRERYAEFLKRDFPRLPLTSDASLFAALAGLGGELVGLHLMTSSKLENLITRFPEGGDGIVEKVRYDASNLRVYINKAQHFEGVPEEVWSFRVGGYQVLDKWLKDRKNRALSFDDIRHYQRTVVALFETMFLMREIDQTIPGWPLG